MMICLQVYSVWADPLAHPRPSCSGAVYCWLLRCVLLPNVCRPWWTPWSAENAFWISLGKS